MPAFEQHSAQNDCYLCSTQNSDVPRPLSFESGTYRILKEASKALLARRCTWQAQFFHFSQIQSYRPERSMMLILCKGPAKQTSASSSPTVLEQTALMDSAQVTHSMSHCNRKHVASPRTICRHYVACINFCSIWKGKSTLRNTATLLPPRILGKFRRW